MNSTRITFFYFPITSTPSATMKRSSIRTNNPPTPQDRSVSTPPPGTQLLSQGHLLPQCDILDCPRADVALTSGRPAQQPPRSPGPGPPAPSPTHPRGGSGCLLSVGSSFLPRRVFLPPWGTRALIPASPGSSLLYLPSDTPGAS